MGFQYRNIKHDSLSIPIRHGYKRRTCRRCDQIWNLDEMVKVGSRYYCKLCYDRPLPIKGGGDKT